MISFQEMMVVPFSSGYPLFWLSSGLLQRIADLEQTGLAWWRRRPPRYGRRSSCVYLLRAGRLSIASFECAQSSAIKARMTEPDVARANKYGQGGERREVPRKVTE